MSTARSVALLCLLPLLGSCGMLGSMFGQAKVEAPPPPDETYLGGNAGTEFDIGKDQESLLEKLHELQTAVRRKDEEITRIKADLHSQIDKARNLDQQLASSRGEGSRSQAEVEALNLELQDLRTRILIMQIRNAQAEQALVERKLSAMQNQLELRNTRSPGFESDNGLGGPQR